MVGLTIHQLLCFDAVVTEGGFQAGATRLRRSHSTVFTSIKNLEDQLRLRLLDRDGYRVALTDAGRRLREKAMHMNLVKSSGLNADEFERLQKSVVTLRDATARSSSANGERPGTLRIRQAVIESERQSDGKMLRRTMTIHSGVLEPA